MRSESAGTTVSLQNRRKLVVATIDLRAHLIIFVFASFRGDSKMKHSRKSHPPNCRHCGKRFPEPSLETRRQCKMCGKEMARTCIYEHQRWHCPKNKTKNQRTFHKKQCRHCKRFFHEKSLSRHVRTHSKKNK